MVKGRDVFLRPLISGSHLFGASPDEYMAWIFWEMTSGFISVCSALGSTVDTCVACLDSQVIRGLFAAGEITSCLHGNSWVLEILFWITWFLLHCEDLPRFSGHPRSVYDG